MADASILNLKHYVEGEEIPRVDPDDTKG